MEVQHIEANNWLDVKIVVFALGTCRITQKNANQFKF